VIPPQSKEEHDGLENSILVNLFDPAYPIIVWDGFIVDGHNRYEICQKHGIDYSISEKDFVNRTDAYNWIIDNQLSRRNLKPDQYSYLRGKNKDDLKLEYGHNLPTFDKLSNELLATDGVKSHNATLKSPNINKGDEKDTASNIAKKDKINRATVFRDARFADAVDEIAENTGINAQDLLAGNLGKITKKDITKIAKEKTPDQQKKLTGFCKILKIT